ncbi:hypothetical protein PMI13_01019 [Chryseobacterium populi]|uniref:Uncharacterized protein n=1 Tax=Chryseobacterium populi TaxID=1144316 RepID=J3CLX5_9FLAO|nr:hypothetical protein PMI13_01019 [Chryseobacterium populi]
MDYIPNSASKSNNYYTLKKYKTQQNTRKTQLRSTAKEFEDNPIKFTKKLTINCKFFCLHYPVITFYILLFPNDLNSL